MTIKHGDKLPLFTFDSLNETNATSDIFLGKNVVFYFYPKDLTPGCTIESKDFRDDIAKFAALDTVVVGISADSLASHEKFKAKHDLPFDLISDTDKTICHLFDVIHPTKFFGKEIISIQRSTFLIDKNGVLQKEWRKVKVSGHVAEVLEAIKSL